MRSKFKTVKNPMIIRAKIVEFRSVTGKGIETVRKLNIQCSTDKAETKMEIDRNKLIKCNYKFKDEKGKKLDVFSFTKTPVWTMLGSIPFRKNKLTRYKDFIYLLRNPHSALLFLSSDNINLSVIAKKIIEGYRIIFPRETRYYGRFKK